MQTDRANGTNTMSGLLGFSSCFFLGTRQRLRNVTASSKWWAAIFLDLDIFPAWVIPLLIERLLDDVGVVADCNRLHFTIAFQAN